MEELCPKKVWILVEYILYCLNIYLFYYTKSTTVFSPLKSIKILLLATAFLPTNKANDSLSGLCRNISIFEPVKNICDSGCFFLVALSQLEDQMTLHFVYNWQIYLLNTLTMVSNPITHLSHSTFSSRQKFKRNFLLNMISQKIKKKSPDQSKSNECTQ